MAERVEELYAKKMELLRDVEDRDQQNENCHGSEGPQLQERVNGSGPTLRDKASPVPDGPGAHSEQSWPRPELSSQKKRKRQIALGEIDPNLGPESTQEPKRVKVSPSSSPASRTAPSRPSSSAGTEIRTYGRTNPLHAPPLHPSASARPAMKKAPVLPSNRPRSAGNASMPRVFSNRSWLRPIERPLNIKPLAAFRGYRRRSDIYDVFVVIQSVGGSVIKRPSMPAKRDIRIVDSSTDKKVLLSIFTEPEKFIPKVGTIALIRNVSTHEYEGGMLNIYPNQCEGKAWFLPDPVGVKGCDVDAMRVWWEQMQAKEAETQAEP